MKLTRQIQQFFHPFLLFYVVGFTILSTARVIFITWQSHRIDGAGDILQILFNGLRIDLSLLSYLAIIPALMWIIVLPFSFRHHLQRILLVWLWLCLLCVIFFEVATPTFILEYDLRPNRLFIEYLMYPKEVATMLFNGHLLSIVLASLTLAILSYVVLRFLKSQLHTAVPKMGFSEGNWFTWASCSLVLLVIIVAGARGTLGHRPLNPSLVYFSQDPLVNTLNLNSMYSVMFAIKQLGKEAQAAKMYGNMTPQKMLDIVKSQTQMPDSAFTDPAIPTLALRQATYQGRPKNLVIILQESLGAQFVKTLGGRELTPNIDKLYQQGWGFHQLYATGTRSVRGIEAVITGFTPTPARSVVKLDKSQHGFFSIAQILQQHDYHTQFVYGGESHFDNMKGFFLGNGFSDIVDIDDFAKTDFIATWGASDGDLFDQAHLELMDLQQQDKPFFSLVFTSSNHDPFEIPPNTISHIQDEAPLDRAIRYADHALGEFMHQAQQSPYWEDTVFLIIADHDTRTYGSELVPIKSFHIPSLIMGKDITPRQDTRLVSQIDMLPTLLSLIGISDDTPALGRDLLRDDIQERAMMQFANNFAYMTRDEVVVLQPQKPSSAFVYDFEAKRLRAKPGTEKMADIALAHVLFGSYAYNNQLYRLPSQPSADSNVPSSAQSSIKQ
ncbi:MAG: LTA synthase family protein [Glaciecola sp.]|nr:LTA synthase family protein [Glaciecola sp.]MDG1814505.1 LTA synthase family protein [Glaciecola sp.]MDG2099563.1 LTA synthase family protein [Glaciecola sp.]